MRRVRRNSLVGSAMGWVMAGSRGGPQVASGASDPSDLSDDAWPKVKGNTPSVAFLELLPVGLAGAVKRQTRFSRSCDPLRVGGGGHLPRLLRGADGLIDPPRLGVCGIEGAPILRLLAPGQVPRLFR